MGDDNRETILADAALAALRRGDAAGALARLRDMRDPPAMLLAQACNRSGDLDGEAAALRRILDSDIRNLPALLAMGQNAQRRGDARGATSWFRSALAQAAARVLVLVRGEQRHERHANAVEDARKHGGGGPRHPGALVADDGDVLTQQIRAAQADAVKRGHDRVA